LDFNKPLKEIKHIKFKTTSTNERKHGRNESRDYAVSNDVEWIKKEFPQWNTINTIGMVEETREIGNERKTGRRYFISSLGAD
jgi:hypothetical protein